MRMLLLFLCSVILVRHANAEDWPQFRGPQGNGHSRAAGLPLTWGNVFERPVWSTQIPGDGWSSPIVIGDRIWLTFAEHTALAGDALKDKLSNNRYGETDFQAHASVSLFAIELRATDGAIQNQVELFEHHDPPPIHSSNSYASPTPVSDGERVYCHFGSLGTAAISMEDGKILWKQRFEIDDITGPGGSPVLCDDRLILACDGVDAQFVVALDKMSGKTLWRTVRPPVKTTEGKFRRAFVTPIVLEHGGRKQIVSPGAEWVVSYDPATGAELWRVHFGSGHALVPRPVVRDGVVYVCTGYFKPELWAIRVDGSGDVSDSHVLWRHNRQVPEISSPIVSGNEIYFVSSIGVASCLDATTGELLWQQRLSGENFGASPLAASGNLYFTSQNGITTVLKAGREFREVAKNELRGRTLASPAVYQDSFLFRTALGLVRIGKTDSPFIP